MFSCVYLNISDLLIGGSIAMTVHFVNQYGNSKAVPLMFLEMTTGGTMWFFVAVTSIGLAWYVYCTFIYLHSAAC